MSDLVWATNPRNDTLDNLVSYLREQVAMQLEISGVQGRLDFPEHLPAHQVSATFRRNMVLIVKEALNNALKHAGASEISVALTLESGVLRLRLTDNGRGFDPSATARGGNGLGNMARRTRDIHGTFELNSAPGQGARIELRIPLPTVI
jgi:signal transduction histidine kinase